MPTRTFLSALPSNPNHTVASHVPLSTSEYMLHDWIFRINEHGFIYEASHNVSATCASSAANFIGMHIVDVFGLDMYRLQQLQVLESLNFLTIVPIESTETAINLKVIRLVSNDFCLICSDDVANIGANDQLLLKVNALEQELEEQKSMNEFKDKILSTVAHDLRSPLNTLSSILDIWEDDKEIFNNEELLSQLKQQLNNSTELLETLYRWARNSFYKMQPVREDVDLGVLIASVLQPLEVAIAQKQIVVNLGKQEPTLISVNKEQMAIVMRNLLTNAIKFTPNQGSINIDCYHRDAYAIIDIADTGIGMDEEQLSNVFSHRMKSTYGTDGEKGSGLGLMLCKEYTAQNNGSLSVTSTKGEGSVFQIRLLRK